MKVQNLSAPSRCILAGTVVLLVLGMLCGVMQCAAMIWHSDLYERRTFAVFMSLSFPLGVWALTIADDCWKPFWSQRYDTALKVMALASCLATLLLFIADGSPDEVEAFKASPMADWVLNSTLLFEFTGCALLARFLIKALQEGRRVNA